MGKKKVFFACSISSGYPFVNNEYLQKMPNALEELDLELVGRHQTQEAIFEQGDEREIHDKHYGSLKDCELVIAEISSPNGDVGAEIADAVNLDKMVLGLYQISKDEVCKYLMGKIRRYRKGGCTQYLDLEQVKRIVKEFIRSVDQT